MSTSRTEAVVTALVRLRNDTFRRAGRQPSPDVDGQKIHTAGIAKFPPNIIEDIWKRVSSYEDFTKRNDPLGEHDFGAFDHPVAGRILWRIDYRNPLYECEPYDIADASTKRIITVMLAAEY